jgi:hypothetical protein
VTEREEPMEFEQRSDELERQADQLEQRGEKVGGHIEEAERDWEANKSDSSVPGAVEDDLDVDDASRSGDQSEAGQ